MPPYILPQTFTESPTCLIASSGLMEVWEKADRLIPVARSTKRRLRYMVVYFKVRQVRVFCHIEIRFHAALVEKRSGYHYSTAAASSRALRETRDNCVQFNLLVVLIAYPNYIIQKYFTNN